MPVAEPSPARPPALKLFISYARHDKLAAQALGRVLQAQGFEVFIDLEALAFGEEWQRQLAQSIAAADTVLWLVSPASVVSRWCQWELGEVQRLSKRLLPMRLVDIVPETLPAAIGRVHMLPAEGLFEVDEHLPQLVRALHTDSAWLRTGTALLQRAHQWRAPVEPDLPAPKADASALLTGAQLRSADAWRQRQPAQAPAPAREVVELILASREAQWRRRTWGAAAALMAVAIAVVAWWQSELARQRSLEALANQSRQLLGAADQALAGGDAARAALVLLEAMPDAARGIARPLLPDAEGRLYAALQALREERVVRDPAGHTLGVMPQAPPAAVPVLGQDHALRLFDTGSGHWREALGPNVVPIATRWSVAGQRLVVSTTAMGDQQAQAYLWDTAQPALIGMLAGHTAEIRATAFSGDGQRLALADADGVVSVHEATRGTVLQRWTVRGTLDALALDTAGRRLAGAHSQGQLTLWDTATGRQQAQRKGSSSLGPKALYFADADLELVAIGIDGGLQRWRPGAGGALGSAVRAHAQQIAASAFARDRLVTGDGGGAAAWWDLREDAGTGAGAAARVQLEWPVRGLDIGADGEWVLIHAGDERARPPENTLHLWQPRQPQGVVELRGHGGLAGMALLAGGERLVTHGGGQLRVWRTQTPAQRAVLADHEAWVTAVSVAPLGARALSHGMEGMARLWDPVAGRALARLRAGGSRVLASAFSADGLQAYLLSHNGELSRWRASDGGELDRVRLAPGQFPAGGHFAPDGRRLLVTRDDQPPSLWDTATGRLVATLDAVGAEPAPGATLRRQAALAAFSGDSRWLLTASEWAQPMPAEAGSSPGAGQVSTLRLEAGLRLWDAATGAPVRRIDLAGVPVEAFVASADGTRVAVGLRGGRVAVYTLPEGRLTFEHAVQRASTAPRWAGLAFSRDGRWLATSYGGEAEVWDVAKASRHVMLARGLAAVGAPAFAPDARLLLTRDGRALRLWDLQSGEPRATLQGHRQTVSALAFDPAGRWVLSGSLDKELRRWPLYASLAELQARAWSVLPRCLTAAERTQLALPADGGHCPASGFEAVATQRPR